MEIPNENPGESSEPLSPAAVSPIELGAWIGKVQAFGHIASRCASAAAEALKHIRESRAYESLGLNWEEFCRQHAGISRSYADKLILRLEEFGEPYFRLSGITPISADTYRAISSVVTQAGIEIDGEVIPFVPENAVRIRQVVRELQADLQQAREAAQPATVSDLRRRLNYCFEELYAMFLRRPTSTEQAAVRNLVEFCHQRLERFVPRQPVQ